MSRKIKTKASKGQFRPQGDKGREMVTWGRTKDLFLSGLKKMKKTLDRKRIPITFHFIGRNDASDKNQKPRK